MNIQERKLTFVQEFLRLEDEEIISNLEKYLRIQKAKSYEGKLQVMSPQQLVEETKTALKDSEENKGMSLNDLIDDIKTWK